MSIPSTAACLICSARATRVIATYDVWAFDGDTMDTLTTVNNGFEALRLVEEYNEFTEISPFILLTAFAVAHGPAPEARAADIPISNGVAGATAVCDIFKELCDCAESPLESPREARRNTQWRGATHRRRLEVGRVLGRSRSGR